MDSDTASNSDELAYWRRRVAVLGAALITAALLAWACSAGSDGGRPRPVGNAGALSSLTPTASQPEGAVPTALPTVTVTATAKVTVTPAVPKKDGDACESADLVVDLTASKRIYVRKEWPQFRLSVVNVGERSCTYDVGPKALQMRITSGSDRVWSSAHCARQTGSSIHLLRRGIPYLTTITWDRRRSTTRCPSKRPTMGKGTYVATLKAPGLKPRKHIFRLR